MLMTVDPQCFGVPPAYNIARNCRWTAAVYIGVAVMRGQSGLALTDIANRERGCTRSGTGRLRAIARAYCRGAINLEDTLAGAINHYSYFAEGTRDDLAGWLFNQDTPLIERSLVGIADAIERIDWETTGNDYMLSGNIAALYATGNPVLIQVASGLEDVAAERWIEYGAAGQAAADAEVENIVRINPLFDDIFFARDVIMGNASGTEIGIRGAGHAIPVIGGIGSRIFAKAESKIAMAAKLGREGELAAGISGAKVGVRIGGRMRFPDEINKVSGVITEIKNVKYQGWTRQLKDYSAYAKSQGYDFVLKVRPGQETQNSRHLLQAERDGLVTIKRGFK